MPKPRYQSPVTRAVRLEDAPGLIGTGASIRSVVAIVLIESSSYNVRFKGNLPHTS
jgi:hypothetical protein